MIDPIPSLAKSSYVSEAAILPSPSYSPPPASSCSSDSLSSYGDNTDHESLKAGIKTGTTLIIAEHVLPLACVDDMDGREGR
jgi:hypothetical protein